MRILTVHTALAAALLALALVPNLSRADDITAGTVICKDGTKVTGTTVEHTGRAECAGRGGIDYTATKALPENANASTASTETSGTAAMVRCMDGTSVAHTGSDACAAHGGMDHSAHMTHGATATPGSEGTPGSNTSAAAGAAGTAGAATAATTAGETTPGSTEESGATSSHDTHLAEAQTSQAPGGGPGKVWVNTQSKKYHCASDHAYGKGSHGEYMTEADAKAQGFQPSHGKACE